MSHKKLYDPRMRTPQGQFQLMINRYFAWAGQNPEPWQPRLYYRFLRLPGDGRSKIIPSKKQIYVSLTISVLIAIFFLCIVWITLKENLEEKAILSGLLVFGSILQINYIIRAINEIPEIETKRQEIKDHKRQMRLKTEASHRKYKKNRKPKNYH